MKIRFHKDTTLYLISGYDEETDTVTESGQETFKAGEVHEVDIVNDNAGYCEIQFGDGSVAYNVPRSSFEML